MGRNVRSDARSWYVLVVILVTAVATFAGWRLTLFCTDDAYIAFRYVSNWLTGRGLVWNPPPFAPVEGYTSFAWCILLGLVWRATGVAPPESSPWLSLGFGYVTLYLGARLLLRAIPADRGPRVRITLLSLVLLATVSNRTFLTWLSSGLETSMFNCCLMWWLLEATTAPEERGLAWMLRSSLAAACLTLVRPDGLLYLGFTVVIVALTWKRIRAGGRGILAALPLLLPFVHLLWRRATYGLWLPNTYYAKGSELWPDAGLRYLLSFTVEHATWVPIGAAVLLWARTRRLASKPATAPGWSRGRRLAILGPIAVLVAHAGYYVLIGGDHFEYRAFSHLVLLAAIAMAWVASRLSPHLRTSALLMCVFIALSWPIGWSHWALSRHATTHDPGRVIAIAPHFPPGARAVAQWWDHEQAWLTRHMICSRHNELKAFLKHQIDLLPTRAEGSKIAWEDGHPVKESPTVGMVGWVWPNVAIIDNLGLNDRVISHTKPRHELGKRRQLAHDRFPPTGYVDCFRPNLWFVDRRTYIMPREEPLTEQQIIDCERFDWSRVAQDFEQESRRRRERRAAFDLWFSAAGDSS